MSERRLSLETEAATVALAEELARGLGADGLVVYLRGDLGAGKTRFAQAFLRALGEPGIVRSPTYTLVEPYTPGGRRVFHMDLYRLADPEELEFVGIRDLDAPDAVLLVEWPDRGEGLLPAPDLEIALSHADPGRNALLRANGPRGEAILARLAA